eukprot:787489-Prymnesium_polylepis.1
MLSPPDAETSPLPEAKPQLGLESGPVKGVKLSLRGVKREPQPENVPQRMIAEAEDALVSVQEARESETAAVLASQLFEAQCQRHEEELAAERQRHAQALEDAQNQCHEE